MTVGSDGVYITGYANAPVLPGSENGANSTPLTPGLGTYVAKLSLDLDEALSATWITRGSAVMTPYAIALGDNVSVYVGGSGRGDLVDTTGAYQPTRTGPSNTDEGFVVHLSADLAVEKTGSPERIANRYMRYWVTVTNNGPDDAVDALIEDTLPPELGTTKWKCSAFNGASCPNANGTGSISETATLPNGGWLEYALCGVVTGAAANIVNMAEATVAGHTLDPVSGNNSDEAVMFDPRIFSDSFEDANLPPFCPPGI